MTASTSKSDPWSDEEIKETQNENPDIKIVCV